MKTSESIESISTALATAQGEFPSVEKTKDNPYFKSKYADLSDILNACRPILAKHGLALIQAVSHDNGRIIVTTRLVHKSGQWFESSLSLRPDKDTPQAIGSVTTYGRRYSAEAMLGIAATHDDDGNVATYGNQAPTMNFKPNYEPKVVEIYTGTSPQKKILNDIFTSLQIKDVDVKATINQEIIAGSIPMSELQSYVMRKCNGKA